MFDLKAYENVPILGPLLLVLTNQSVVYAAAGALAVYLVPQHQDYSLLLQSFIATAALIAIGTRQWRDMHAFLQANRPVIEKGLTELLHTRHEIKVGNRTVLLDIPDSIEPELRALILSKIDGLFRDPDAQG